jgi:hypothetical protein
MAERGTRDYRKHLPGRQFLGGALSLFPYPAAVWIRF